MKYQCPKCKSINLRVVAKVWANVIQGSKGAIVTEDAESLFAGHEWDADSRMECRDCGHSSKVWRFDPDRAQNKKKVVP